MLQYWWVALLVIPLLFIFSGFVTGCFEKDAVRPFSRMQLQSIGSYATEMMRSAVAGGFLYRDSGVHTVYPDKISAVLLLSADGSTLAVISQGTLIGMAAKKTALVTRFGDGSFLMTVDEAGLADLDPMTTRQILMNASWDELLRGHSRKLAELMAQGRMVDLFPYESTWDQLEQVYRQKADRIVARGLARYTDQTRAYYRMTVWGSFRATILHALVQILYLPNHWRHLKRRPG